MYKLISLLNLLSRRKKIMVQLSMDAGLILLSILFAMVICTESLEFAVSPDFWVAAAVTTALTLAYGGYVSLYRSKVRYITGRILLGLLKLSVLAAVVFYTCVLMLSVAVPLSAALVLGMSLFLSISGLRFFVRNAINKADGYEREPVLIFGAGKAGVKLAAALNLENKFAVCAFVDDDPLLQGLTVSGLRVYSRCQIEMLKNLTGAKQLLLALPKLEGEKRHNLLKDLQKYGLKLKTVPSITDIIAGTSQISELRSVDPKELLGRPPVEPNDFLMKLNTCEKVVMVTGAGGSIGSELCRQVLTVEPSTIVLFEVSEFALYRIQSELSDRISGLANKPKIVALLGSVQDQDSVSKAMSDFGVQTIFHAAAYKHVPLVESNIVEGIRNNIFGTLAVARAAVENKVDNFILISTDKAVRPTNIMGATKRVAELVCQSLAEKGGNTKFSMVRFGNVLGSSGSVIPKFQSQIENGGPITLTHPDIIRYFMTIPEAAQLVIQAGAMGEGGEVYVLDMGEPVRILDLAFTLARLHGLEPVLVEDQSEVSLDKTKMPICITGLRPGEKLYEELLVGNNPRSTVHPRIMCANEISYPYDKLVTALQNLRIACGKNDLGQILSLLDILPLDYTPDNETRLASLENPKVIEGSFEKSLTLVKA